ncbi:MAG: SEL1-like repeat protein [Bacteroidales bacterium]|nr:SEL1-like repeat protein [Bacteroidales bacterium]
MCWSFQYYKLGYEKGAGPVAAYNLGRCYYFGRGVDKDLEMAQELFKEAEGGGFPVREKLNEK